MLMFEIWSLGEKPFPHTDKAGVSMCLSLVITVKRTKYGNWATNCESAQT